MNGFKEVPGLPGFFASEGGIIKTESGKIVKQSLTGRGYFSIQITQNGARKNLFVHRIIASTFLGDVTGMEVDHLNFDKTDNTVKNLEIVTKTENMRRFHESEQAENTYANISVAQKKRWEKVERKHYEANKRKNSDDGSPPKKRGRPVMDEGDKMVTKNFCISKNQAALLKNVENESEEVRKALAKAGFPEQSNKSEQ